MYPSRRPRCLELLELLEWLRDKLERLHRLAESKFVRRNLHALIRACDPETNPRLKNAVEEMRVEGRPTPPHRRRRVT